MALQSAADFGDHIVKIALGGVFTLQVWMVRALIDVRSDTRVTRTTLFGETGNNGINGTVRKHDDEIRGLEVRVARLEP
jgi:hypothetical protein